MAPSPRSITFTAVVVVAGLIGLVMRRDGCAINTAAGAKRSEAPSEAPPVAQPAASEWENRSLKLVCMVMRTRQDKDLERSKIIEEHWGKACDVLEFPDAETPGLVIDWEETTHTLSKKAHRSWLWTIKKHMIDAEVPADIIMKADLDTYILKDNARTYLKKFHPDQPHYIGRQFVTGSKQEFVAGASVSLTRAAALKFYHSAHPLPEVHEVGDTDRHFTECEEERFSSFKHGDDLALGVCFVKLGIFPDDTRDSQNRERFLVFKPQHHYSAEPKLLERKGWYANYSYNRVQGKGSASKEAVAFHFVSADELKKEIVWDEAGEQWSFKD